LTYDVQYFTNGQSPLLTHIYTPFVSPNSKIPAQYVNYYGLTSALSTGLLQCPTRRTGQYLASAQNNNNKVYLYSFDYVPVNSPYASLLQSVHGQELAFVFGTPNTLTPTFTPQEQQLSQAMMLLWTRFIVNGNPNIPLLSEQSNPIINMLVSLGGWPAYSSETNNGSNSYLTFANNGSDITGFQFKISKGYHQPQCGAWDSVVPNPLILKRCAGGYKSVATNTTNECQKCTSWFQSGHRPRP